MNSPTWSSAYSFTGSLTLKYRTVQIKYIAKQELKVVSVQKYTYMFTHILNIFSYHVVTSCYWQSTTQPEMPHLACCKLLILTTWYNFIKLLVNSSKYTVSVLKWNLMQLDVCRFVITNLVETICSRRVDNNQLAASPLENCNRFIVNKISAYWYWLVSTVMKLVATDLLQLACFLLCTCSCDWMKQLRALLVWMTLTCSRHACTQNE